jgi:hypothetical protein
MANISTSTRKRLKRARSRKEREIGQRTPLRNTQAFRFDASLRIAGIGAQHDRISIETGLIPSSVHRAGDLRSPRSPSLGVWPEDYWELRSPLGEHATLEEHISWLWSAVEPHKPYFARIIIEATWADICLGCLSESAYPFFTVGAASLDITRELNLGLSFNFTCV